MNSYQQLSREHFGALELRQNSGHYLLLGLLFSILAHALFISTPYLVSAIRGERSLAPQRVVPPGISFILPPFQHTAPPPASEMPQVAPPKPVRPGPVPFDKSDPGITRPPKQGDWKDHFGGNNPSGMGDFDPGDFIPVDPVIPSDPIPSDFVPFEVAPQPLPDFSPFPEYPAIARSAGIKGFVIVQAFVDKTGLVKKFSIIESKPHNLGFEEAVSKVIPDWRFTPAIQNGKPIGVWVKIPFNFELDN